jgi:hypothetical protein
MRCCPVSAGVSNVANDDAECSARVEIVQEQQAQSVLIPANSAVSVKALDNPSYNAAQESTMGKGERRCPPMIASAR